MNREVKNILTISKEKKYSFFLKKVADYEEVWSLKNDTGWVTLGKGNEVFFPIWAKKEFSDICISDEWEGCHSQSIDLYEFMEYWITGLKEDNIRITVMWYEGEGLDIGWERLQKDIECELQNY